MPAKLPHKSLELVTDDEVDEMGRLWRKMTPAERIYSTARLDPTVNKKEAARLTRKDKADKVGNTPIADKLEKTPIVQRYLQLATRSAVRRTIITRETVLNGLMDAVEAAGTSAELTAAWREIGRVVGAYAPETLKVDFSVRDLTAERLATLPSEKLIELTRVDDDYVLPDTEDVHGAQYQSMIEALRPPEPLDGYEAS